MDKFLRPEVLGVILIFGVPTFAIIAHFWYQAQKLRSDNELKRTMVERGMSAEEIERVIAAGSETDAGKCKKARER